MLLLRCRSRWGRIGICRCTGREADLVVITALYLSDCVQITDCQFYSSNVLTAFTMELRYTKNLKISIVEMFLTDANCRALEHGLSRNHTIESLDLRNMEIMSSSVKPLARGLRESRCLQILNLRFCRLRDPQLAMLLEALKGHIALRELYLRGNFCREDAIHQIGGMLTHPNCSLRTLDISRQSHSASFPMRTLADALRSNQTLRFLDVASNSLNDRDIGILCDSLIDNLTLEHLILTGANPMSSIGAKRLFEIMKTNYSLQRLRIPTNRPEEVKYQRKITFLANLNRAGRILLFRANDAPIPRAFWGTVLERINKIEWGERGRRWSRPNMIASKSGQEERASIIFDILRGSPILLER